MREREKRGRKLTFKSPTRSCATLIADFFNTIGHKEKVSQRAYRDRSAFESGRCIAPQQAEEKSLKPKTRYAKAVWCRSHPPAKNACKLIVELGAEIVGEDAIADWWLTVLPQLATPRKRIVGIVRVEHQPPSMGA